MKFESVISETKAKGEQVWLAFDHNGDQLQLDPKWLDGGIRGPLADYVFLIRVVSICDGCPFYSHQPLMAYVMFASCELPRRVCCPLAARGGAHPPSCRPLSQLVYAGLLWKQEENLLLRLLVVFRPILFQHNWRYQRSLSFFSISCFLFLTN